VRDGGWLREEGHEQPRARCSIDGRCCVGTQTGARWPSLGEDSGASRAAPMLQPPMCGLRVAGVASERGAAGRFVDAPRGAPASGPYRPRPSLLFHFFFSLSPTHLVVLVRAVREVEAGDGHARPQQVLQDGDLPRLGAERADDLRGFVCVGAGGRVREKKRGGRGRGRGQRRGGARRRAAGAALVFSPQPRAQGRGRRLLPNPRHRAVSGCCRPMTGSAGGARRAATGQILARLPQTRAAAAPFRFRPQTQAAGRKKKTRTNAPRTNEAPLHPRPSPLTLVLEMPAGWPDRTASRPRTTIVFFFFSFL
jgi:hypothetical protein